VHFFRDFFPKQNLKMLPSVKIQNDSLIQNGGENDFFQNDNSSKKKNFCCIFRLYSFYLTNFFSEISKWQKNHEEMRKFFTIFFRFFNFFSIIFMSNKK
jgi:hypothetical protein